MTWSPSDRAARWSGELPVMGVAVAAAGGALAARPVPVALAAGIAAVVHLVLRSPATRLLVLAGVVAAATSMAAVRALGGLDDIVEATDFRGTVVLLTDPEVELGGSVRFEARAGGRHVVAEIEPGPDATAVARRLAGERLVAHGTLGPLTHPSAWTRSRHLAGRLRVTRVEAMGGAAPHAAVANGLRRVLERGSASLGTDSRALLFGLTLGDDRRQSSALTADFRSAGLAHLVAVSGQNLVLVLSLCGPLLRRVRIWPRLVLAGTVVVGFAFATRFEPSVTRAAAVALVAAWASTVGRPAGGLRYLALAVIGLLVVDPLLVHSIGFRLSVAASVGVLVIAPALRPRLRAPDWVAEPLALTVGAQLAVAPVSVPAFGAMPLVAVPANVVAAPFAALTTAWGLVGGVIAGVVPAGVAGVVHLPTRVATSALAAVARVGAATPLGGFDLRHVAVAFVAAALWSLDGGAVTGRRITAAALVLAASVAAVAAPVPAGSVEVGWAGRVWTDGPAAIVEVDPGASAVDLLVELRRRRVTTVGLVVVGSDDPGVAEVVSAVRSRFPVSAVIAPDHSPLSPDRVVSGQRIRVGRFVVEVVETSPDLVVRIGPASRRLP